MKPCETDKCPNFVPMPEPGKRGRPHKYCSICANKRLQESVRRAQRKQRGKPLDKPPCRICGDKLRGRASKYCSTCKPVVARILHNTTADAIKLYRDSVESRAKEFEKQCCVRDAAEQALVDEAHRLSKTGLTRRDVSRTMHKHYDTVSKLLSQLPTWHPAYKPLDYFLIPDPPAGLIAGENLNFST